MDLYSVFKDKKVFLTGHTGFKGAWLLMMLHRFGARVKGYALAPRSSEDLYHRINGDNLCESVIADIRDQQRLCRELLDFKPDFVFHLAAQALVLESYQHPVETYATNVMGTVHVLDALRFLDQRCTAVIITTDKVYENLETTAPYNEDARLGGFDPYSNSKACCELVIDSYRKSFFNPGDYKAHKKGIASARSGNVIGGGDWSENRLIPDIARALIADRKISIRNPESVRPWQHVLDPLSGYLHLAAQLDEDPVTFATGYNFGPDPDDERTVLDMCKLAIDYWGKGSFEVALNESKPHEAGLLKLDISKARTELGWRPVFNSAEAVRWTIEWYKEGRSHARDFTEQQIRTFLDLQ